MDETRAVTGPPSHSSTQGLLDLGDHSTWFRRVRPNTPAREKAPLLMLHGGPGMNSEYFAPLEAALRQDRTLVRYDQLASGRSSSPRDVRVEGFAPFIDELAAVRDQLDLDRIHLLGHSWGGMLALEYALTAPAGVESLVLASSPFSAPLWAQETTRLRRELPTRTQTVLDRCEAQPATPGRARRPRRAVRDQQLRRQARGYRLAFNVGRHPFMQSLALPMSRVRGLRSIAGQLAQLVFTQRHVCRLDRPPPEFFSALVGWNFDLYQTLWGPSEFQVTGTLREWDLSDRLGDITVPTLITSGRYDEATPPQMERLAAGIRGSRWTVFENSAHMAHMEEPERYVETLRDFLAEVEGA